MKQIEEDMKEFDHSDLVVLNKLIDIFEARNEFEQF